MTRRRRTIDFLIRRGFSGSVAADSVRRALQGSDHD
jgi:SOS response regulatory protein OraA/RecX